MFSAPLRVLVIAVLSGVLRVGGTVQAQSTRTTTDTIAVDPDVEVELHAFRGRVEVTTWERSAVRLHGKIEDSTSGASPKIQVSRGDSTLTVKPNGKTVESPGLFTMFNTMVLGREEPDGPKTTYLVRVPAEASVTLSLDAANAEVTGVEGPVKIEGVSSSITVRDVGGKVLAGTVSGTLYAEDVRGKLLLGTFSGDLEARLSALTDDLRVGSFSGDAKITLPADAAFDLKTDVTWGGSVTSDFAMPDSSSQKDGAVPIGGGGPTITFGSFSGSLTLRAE